MVQAGRAPGPHRQVRSPGPAQGRGYPAGGVRRGPGQGCASREPAPLGWPEHQGPGHQLHEPPRPRLRGHHVLFPHRPRWREHQQRRVQAHGVPPNCTGARAHRPGGRRRVLADRKGRRVPGAGRDVDPDGRVRERHPPHLPKGDSGGGPPQGHQGGEASFGGDPQGAPQVDLRAGGDHARLRPHVQVLLAHPPQAHRLPHRVRVGRGEAKRG